MAGEISEIEVPLGGKSNVFPEKLRRCVFELDYNCNLKCLTCNIWRDDFNSRRGTGWQSPARQQLRLEKLLEIPLEQVTFLGGEPLLNQHLWTLLETMKTSGPATALVSNGTLLDESLDDTILKSGLKTLIVSLDGPPAVHDKIRGRPGTFIRLFESVRRIQKLKKMNGLALPKVLIYTTISSLNHSTLGEFLPYIRKLDVNGIRFQLVSVLDDELVGRTNRLFAEDTIAYHSYAVPKKLRLNHAEVSRLRGFLAASEPLFKKWGVKRQLEGVLAGNTPPGRCRFIHTSVVINPSGEVLPCPMLTAYSLGNCYSQSVEALWGNSRHQRLRHIFAANGGLPVCRECCVEKIWP